jgi:hypothetical protein
MLEFLKSPYSGNRTWCKTRFFLNVSDDYMIKKRGKIAPSKKIGR